MEWFVGHDIVAGCVRFYFVSSLCFSSFSCAGNHCIISISVSIAGSIRLERKGYCIAIYIIFLCIGCAGMGSASKFSGKRTITIGCIIRTRSCPHADPVIVCALASIDDLYVQSVRPGDRYNMCLSGISAVCSCNIGICPVVPIVTVLHSIVRNIGCVAVFGYTLPSRFPGQHLPFDIRLYRSFSGFINFYSVCIPVQSISVRGLYFF